jgi:long-subunit fatty acid transport protein
MLKIKRRLLSILLLIVIIASPLSAQVKKEKQKKETTKQVHVDLKDGKKIEGKLIERIGDTVVIETDSFIAHVNIKNIKSIEELNTDKTNLYKYLYNENRHAPHGFFAPTGFGLRKGEGYYKNFYLFMNHLNYGFTDNFSLEFSTETLSLLASGNGTSPFQVIYLVPKLSYTVAKDVNLGIGMYIARLGSDLSGSNGTTFAVPFGVTTFGNRNNNLSVGLGTLLFSPSANETNIFVLSLSGQLRLAKNFGLVTENYLFKSPNFGFSNNSSFPLNSIGMRYMSHSFSFDVGVSFTLGQDNFRLPVLGFSVPFGHKK